MNERKKKFKNETKKNKFSYISTVFNVNRKSGGIFFFLLLYGGSHS